MSRVDLELVEDGSVCVCAHELSPRTPVGQTVRLLIDDVQRGFYCTGCLGGMIEAMVAVAVNAAVMKATTKVGDLVTWSDMPMTVLEVAEHGARTDSDFLDGWFAWEVLEPCGEQP